MDFVGTWLLYEMGLWDEDYFNMEVQAYIEIDSNNQEIFNWSSGGLHAELLMMLMLKERFYSGLENDECDPASGSGRSE